VNLFAQAFRRRVHDGAILHFRSDGLEHVLLRRRENASVRDRRKPQLAQPSKQVAVSGLVCGGYLFAACAINYCGAKLYVITPLTLTGSPLSLTGENLAPRAAATAAACNSGWPETACAEITLPFSSTVT